MKNWKNPFIKINRVNSVLGQMFVCGFYSFVGMNMASMICLLINYHPDKQMIFGFFGGIIIICFFIAMFLVPCNILFLLLLHYLKIFPYFMCFPIGVIFESALYYWLFSYIDYTTKSMYSFSFLLPFVVLLTIIILFRIIINKYYNSLHNKIMYSMQNNNVLNSFIFGKKTDVFMSFLLPSIMLLILKINI